MTKNKEYAVADFWNMTTHSWTYERMTEEEKARCLESFRFANEQGMIAGSFRQRWNICQAIYHTFLNGIGYSGFEWRDPPEDKEAIA